MSLAIVAISDTHGLHRAVAVPPGDVLVHAGDLTRHGTLDELNDLNEWLGELPHRVKVVIAGNHDFCCQNDEKATRARLTNAVYLCDEALIVDGVTFYGSPWQPWFYDWAFNLPRGPRIRAKWDLIPPQTNVLITHGPPLGHGDLTSRGKRAGCADLLEVVEQIRPPFHIFGHIHEGYSVSASSRTTFVNASVCNLAYRPVNAPVALRYPLGE